MSEIRKCGHSWTYCDGDCKKCETISTDSTVLLRTMRLYDLTDETIERIAKEVVRRLKNEQIH